MYSDVKYVDEGYPRLVFSRLASADNEMNEYFEIPVEAITNRMELYGLGSVEESLEYIFLEKDNRAVADSMVQAVDGAYNAVANAEFAQMLMPVPRLGAIAQKQTLMMSMDINPGLRTKLDEARTQAREALGMRKAAPTEPGLRMMSTAEVSQVAEQVGEEADLIRSAVGLLEGKEELLEAWRVQTLVSHVPQLRGYLTQGVEEMPQVAAV